MSKWKGNDFWDWISPMIVRELRQGMRTKVFTFAFVLLICVLVTVTVTSLAASSAGGSASSEGLWICLMFFFLLVMPLRGIQAVSTELKMQTMDMLLQTRLTAWKIIFGKWAALVLQSLLVAFVLLPFVVLRYYVGGIDIPGELGRLLLLVILSASLTAFTVGLSTQKSVALRGIVTLLAAFFLLRFAVFWIVRPAMYGRGGFYGGPAPAEWVVMLRYIIICLFTVYFLLAAGASQIAPPWENHAIRKRVVALIYVSLVGLFWTLDLVDEGLLRVALLILAIPVADALTEKPTPTVSVCMPFLKRGWISRGARWFLYPGWQSGLLFTGLLSLGCGLILVAAGSLEDLRSVALTTAVFGTVVFPAAIVWFFMPKAVNPFGAYLVVMMLSLLACAIVASIGNEYFLWMLFPLPISCVMLIEFGGNFGDFTELLWLCLIATFCWILLLIVRHVPVRRRFREVEEECLKLLESERARNERG